MEKHQINDKVFDRLLAQAVIDNFYEEYNALPSPEILSRENIVSERFDKRMTALLKKEERKERFKKFADFSKKVAAILLIFITVISGILMINSNDEVENDSIVNSGITDEEPLFQSRRAPRWVEIPIGENSGFSDEVFKIIETSKSMKEDAEYYALFSSQELSDISEFYSLDKLKIEGYQLEKAFVNSVNFIYQYFPYNYDEELASISDRIVITITRQDWIDTHLPDTDLLINAMESYDPGIANITKDNMLYFETAGLIKANIGRTTVSIQPQGLEKHDNYEYLYNLVLLITETAELISVKT